MNMQMCNNGHFYDADVHAECPACNRQVEENMFPRTGIVTDFPSTGSYMAKQIVPQENSYPKTAAVSNASQEYPKTSPVGGMSTEFPKTMPMNAAPTEFPKTAPIGTVPQEFPKTAPVEAAGSIPKTAPVGGVRQTPSFTGWNPILGWLVCIQGGKQGKDFRLTQETSYIGRAASNDICLDFDEAISRDTTITITYVKQSRVFRLNSEQSRNPVLVNGVPVMTELYLRDKDVISVGSTQLKLVCFCDASFVWEN
ncbi:MAG: FHA domain-containing protein [Lachnospiraceae bacterium]|nr:FHA domain-containing protein [Lachnospiraceae bacterium]